MVAGPAGELQRGARRDDVQPPLRVEHVAEPEQVVLVGAAPVVEHQQPLGRARRRALAERQRAHAPVIIASWMCNPFVQPTPDAASRTAASSARTDGRRASAVRVAAKMVRCTGPSAIVRTTTPGMGAGRDEVGQERDREALGDEPEAEDAVVGAVADVRVEAAELPAGPRGHLLPGRAGVAGRPDRAGELGQRHRARVPARDRMALGQDEVDRVAVQVVAVDAGGPRERQVLPLVGQDEIDVAERERGQRRLGLGLDELAAQAGRVARERVHRRGGQAQRDGLERRDPPAPDDAARGRRELGLGELGPLEQGLGVADQDERRVGQADAAPRPLEQRHAGLALEHRELLRDGRGRELQRVGDGGDRPPLVQLVQQAQAAEVEHVKQCYLNERQRIRIVADA